MQGNIQILLRLVGREVLRGIETYILNCKEGTRRAGKLIATCDRRVFVEKDPDISSESEALEPKTQCQI